MVTPSNNRSTGASRVLLYVTVALVGAIMLARFSIPLAALVAILALAPLVVAAVRGTRARLGLVQPDFDPQTGGARMREFETLPFENPFDPANAHLPLESRISMAAEASANYSRGVSVLFLAVDDQAETQRAYATLRDALRPSDHVEIIEGGVVVCLNLIRDLANVDGVIARLTRRLAEAGWPQSSPPRFGRALYPMHGYSGGDLIEAARTQVRPSCKPAGRNARRVDPSSDALPALGREPRAQTQRHKSARTPR